MKNQRRTSLVITLICILFLCISAHAAEHKRQRPVKTGILLAAFGSSVPEAQAAFDNIDKKVKAAFPDIPVRWAYTSSMIRHKLAKQGKQLDSVEMALAKMMDEKFTHVVVQSLHSIPGMEFHDLQRNAQAFGNMAGGFDRIYVSYPLLATDEDMVKATECVIRTLPKERKPDEAIVFMGHGSAHPSNAMYTALMYHLQRKDPNLFMGTVEGNPRIEDIKKMLLEKSITKAYLIPFMSVAGDHARNDMAGDEPDSWKSVLTKSGIACVPVLKGLAEYDEFVNIWVDHLKSGLTHIQ